MKTRRSPIARRLLLASASILIGSVVQPFSADAATYTWIGTGTQSWDTTANWSSTAPVSGSTTTINIAGLGTSGVANVVLTDIPADFTLNTLTFSGTGERSLGTATVGGTLNFSANGSGTSAINFNNRSGQVIVYSALSVATSSTLVIAGSGGQNALFRGAITGDGAVLAKYANNTMLYAVNDFSGGLTISGGNLVVMTSTATLGTGTITWNSGRIRAGSGSGAAGTGYTVANTLVLGDTPTFGGHTTVDTTFTFTGATTLAASTGTTVVTVSGSGSTSAGGNSTNTPVVLAGAIGDDGQNRGISIKGTGILEYAGATANSYTGITQVDSATATLYLNKDAGVTAVASGTLQITDLGGTVKIGQDNSVSSSTVLQIDGGATGTFDLNGHHQKVAELNGAGALGVVTNSKAGTTSNFTVGNSNNSAYNGVVQNGAGTVNFIKEGTGKVTLGGNNTYSGSTTVKTGTLALAATGSISNSNTISVESGAAFDTSAHTSAYAIASGQRLSNDGVVSGALNISGIVEGSGTFGNALAVLSGGQLISEGATISGDLSLASGAVFSFTLDSLSSAKTIVGGTASISGATLNLTLGSFSVGDKITLIDAEGISGNFGSVTIGSSTATLTSNAFMLDGISCQLDYAGGANNNDIILTVVAVPEPGTWATMVGGFGVLLFMRRMRFSKTFLG